MSFYAILKWTDYEAENTLVLVFCFHCVLNEQITNSQLQWANGSFFILIFVDGVVFSLKSILIWYLNSLSKFVSSTVDYQNLFLNLACSPCKHFINIICLKYNKDTAKIQQRYNKCPRQYEEKKMKSPSEKFQDIKSWLKW